MMELDELTRYIKTVLRSAAQGLVDGSQADVTLFFDELAADLVEAAAEDDAELLAVTIARLRLVEERTRIRANEAALDVLEDVAKAAFALAKGVLL